MRVLLADHDTTQSAATQMMLGAEGFTVWETDLAEEACEVARFDEFCAIVTAMRLADGSAVDLVRRLRRAGSSLPVLVLDADARVETKVATLAAGADDYLTRPYHRAELAARLRALVRRQGGQTAEPLECGPITLDLAERRVRVDGQAIHLTGKEYAVCEAMMLRLGHVFTKGALMTSVYGGLDEPAEKIVDVFVCKIRKKLGPAAVHLETHWGHGYRMVAERSAPLPAMRDVPIQQDCPALEVAKLLLDVLRQVAPRDMGYRSLAVQAGDVTETTVRRALAHLTTTRQASCERAAGGYRWRAAA